MPWPARGSVVDLPDDEAAAMCRSGLAKPANENAESDVEMAVPDDDSEKRSGLTKANSGAVTSDSGQEGQAPKEKPAPASTEKPAPAPSEKQAPAAPAKAPAKRAAAKPQGDSK
ncbi:hypothetical protein [Streptomyces bungoensis]|uniref:hypothetical protein n=1 Tax=Streptomyces bungoensis TaxID=285568 RepID=UPI00342F19CC